MARGHRKGRATPAQNKQNKKKGNNQMFGKVKTAEDVLKLIQGLSEEEQDKLFDELLKDEDENGTPDKVEEVSEEVTEETEADAPVEEVEEVTEEAPETEEEAAPAEEAEAVEEEEVEDEKSEENRDEIVKALADRVNALENSLKELADLKEKLDEMAKKKAEEFGYKGYGSEKGKDYSEMSADELAKECLIKA